MLIAISQQLIAQIESFEVDMVRDFRIGDRPSKAQQMRIADLAVAKRF